MPRTARQGSNSGIYHVMVRGINRQDIFLDHEDYERYLSTLSVVKARSGCRIHSYCLMNNHVHLLLQEGEEKLSQVMKRIGASYVRWYNTKRQRVGHLFQDRFQSQAVEDDAYLLTVARYIHQNPVKAGLAIDYPWSSYQTYALPEQSSGGLVDTDLVLGVAGGRQQFIEDSAAEVVAVQALEDCHPVSDETVGGILRELLGGQVPGALKVMKKRERDETVRQLRSLPGVTCAQIARITGLSLSAVLKTSKTD